MVKTRSLILVTALILLGSVAMSQPFESPEDSGADSNQSSLGEGVIAYNFVMRGLPGNSQEEVEADRSFERESDSNESFDLSEDDALEVAREELGSGEWNLEDSEQSEGLYEFEFVRGESEAEVSVDGSSGKIVEFEAEVEWEPENEESSAVLSGFIQFNSESYGVDTDIEVDEENNEAFFEVEIEQADEVSADVLTRRDIREFEDAAPGSYTGTLEVVRDDEVVHTEEQNFRVPGSTENESEEQEDDSEDSLEEMSREELIEEVKSLREQVQSLKERPEAPEEDSEDDDSSDDDSDEQEDDETESEESSQEESDSEQSETPGNSGQRPGFVNRMLSGIFG